MDNINITIAADIQARIRNIGAGEYIPAQYEYTFTLDDETKQRIYYLAAIIPDNLTCKADILRQLRDYAPRLNVRAITDAVFLWLKDSSTQEAMPELTDFLLAVRDILEKNLGKESEAE